MSSPNGIRTLQLTLDGQSLDPQHVWAFARTALDPGVCWAIDFSPEAIKRMQASAEVVAKLSRADEPVYGVNTGFGHFAERRIPPDQLEPLQANLIRSHACGVGEEIARDLVLALWLMVQVTAAALVGECKTLCMPASVDSIPTNCDREDHVSMGPIAGLKALQVIEHVRQILALELLVAAQALDLRRNAVVPERIATIHHRIRQRVPFLTQDRALSSDIAAIKAMIDSNTLWV